MVFWFIEFNYVNVVITLLISLCLMALGLVLFRRVWLSLPELQIPTTYAHDTYKFGPNISFVKKMRILILDIRNQDFWIRQIGFDGRLTRLLLPPFPPQDHPGPLHLRLRLLLRLPLLLPDGKGHEHGLPRKRLLQRHGH
jgi:hypothetical protein